MSTEQHDIRFGVPLYTIAESARALAVPRTTFASWARGDERNVAGRRKSGAPVVTALPESGREPVVPFVGSAEGMVLAAVRKVGVPLQRIRPAMAALEEEIGVAHALASRRLYTDGAEILFDHAASPAATDDAIGDLVVVRNGQRTFRDVIVAFLQRIEYGVDGYATSIRLPAYEVATVVADPRRSFGQPIIERGGARVDDVLERFWAGDSIRTLSEEFGVPVADVEDVLRAASRAAA